MVLIILFVDLNRFNWSLFQIEEAEEATPSPEAHAIQSLNASRHEEQQRSNKNGRSTPETSVLEIPLEDMGSSKKTKEKSTLGTVADYLTGRSSKKPGGAVQRLQRSSSYSPNRLRSQSPGAEASGGKSSSRGSTPERSRPEGRGGELRRGRAGSFPSPRRSSSGSSTGSAGSKVSSTSFMVKPKSSDSKTSLENVPKPDESDFKEQSESRVKSVASRTRSNSSGACPKTLIPAPEPTVSLLANLDNTSLLAPSVIDSPKLVPPAEPDRIRSFSDTSSIASMDSEASTSQSVSSASQGGPPSVNSDTAAAAASSVERGTKPPPLAEDVTSPKSPAAPKSPFQVSSQGKSGSPADTSTAEADPERVEQVGTGEESASDQLSRLAQIAQEQNFTFMDDSMELSRSSLTDKTDSVNITDDDKEVSQIQDT